MFFGVIRKLALPLAAVGILGVIGALMNTHEASFAGGPSVTIEGPLPLPVTGTVKATLPTHLGVPLTNLVSLNCLPSNLFVASSACSSFRQFDANGVQSATDYTIPPGQTLILTDVEWETRFGAAGRIAFLSLGCTSGCAFVYSSRAVGDVAGSPQHRST